MHYSECKKAIAIDVVDLLDYTPDEIEIRSIFSKITGSINGLAFDSGKLLKGKVSPFDNFIQIVEGKAQIKIDQKTNLLEKGQLIIIPAHSQITIKAITKMKLISTVIKSGYEEISI